jgi:hypothetical protein
MAATPADIRNDTDHRFLYMFGWSPVSNGHCCHDRFYHHQPFDPLDTGIFYYNGHHQKELRKYN